MDPTLTFILRRDTFNQPELIEENARALPYRPPLVSWPALHMIDLAPPEPTRSYLTSEDQALWSSIRDGSFVDPVTELPSPFPDRSALTLASIDASYAITGCLGGYLARQDDRIFSFTDLSPTSGWSVYVQWRRPNGYGFGMTSSPPFNGRPLSGGWNPPLAQPPNQLVWDWRFLSRDQYQLTYGPDQLGRIEDHPRWFGDWVRETQVDGVDLALAQPNRSQVAPSLLASLIGLAVGGSLVLRFPDTWSDAMGRYLYLAGSCFDQMALFKPLPSLTDDPARYFIGLGRRSSIEPLLGVLTRQDQPVPSPDFVAWLRQNNHDFLIDLRRRRDLTQEYGLSLYRAPIVWDLPSTLLK